MFVLVFWIESKEVSIVRQEDLCSDAGEREECMVMYKDKKTYRAVVVKKSWDENYLANIKVDTEGNILPMKGTSSKASTSSNKIKTTKKDTAANSKASRQKKLQSLPSIFEDSEKENSDDEIIGPSSKKLKTADVGESDYASDEYGLGYESDEEKKGDRERRERERREREDQERREREDQERREREDQERREREDQERRERERREREDQERRERERREREDQERREREDQERREREDQERRERERRERDDQERRERERREQEDQERREREDPERREQERNDRDIRERERQRAGNANQVDPLEECRISGPGKVRLCRVYNVWIHEADITYMQRWLDNPRELVRRLFKKLVGEHHLMYMCARGRSRNTQAIPEDIISAIEYYVNRRCTSTLRVVDFTNVINMMCASLRHPRR